MSMAEVEVEGKSAVDKEIKAVIQSFYNLMVDTIDYQADVGQDVMKKEIKDLTSNLRNLASAASHLDVELPPDLFEYVQDGRNPDIYQRDLVEAVWRKNQELKGRAEGFAMFRDLLAKEIVSHMPDLKPVVTKVSEDTGGKLDAS